MNISENYNEKKFLNEENVLSQSVIISFDPSLLI